MNQFLSDDELGKEVKDVVEPIFYPENIQFIRSEI
jgi:hypothetical protein